MMDAAGGQPAIASEAESSPLIYLPPEIWRKILKKIDQKEALNLRLVNQDFMAKVDNLYEDWIGIRDTRMIDAAGGQPAIASEAESSPLIDLPPEIWVEILKKIGQKDALNLCLVNQDFMAKVDNLYEDWNIKLDENSPYLEMILDLRVKEVEVCNLNRTPLFRPPGVLFKYPDLIQKLTLDLSKTSTQIAQILLQSRNLKSISLKLRDYYFEPFEVLSPLGYNYPELHTLEIDLKIYKKQVLEPGNLFHRILMNSTMPKLKSFTFSYDSHNGDTIYNYHEGLAKMDTIYNCSSVLLSFLSRNGQNLQHFQYTNWISSRHSFPGFPTLDDSIVLKNMRSLENLSLYCGTVDPLHNTWRRLTQNQTKLVDLSLGHELNISSTLLREICAKNFQTLTSVYIQHEGQAEGVFDTSIFKDCHNLIELQVLLENDDLEAGNLSSLPTQIQTLDLGSFGVDSEDLMNFLVAHPVISVLNVYSGGNLPVLEAILTHGTLIFAGIGGIELPASPADLARLNQIFESLKCPKVEGQFDFNDCLSIHRESVIENWKYFNGHQN